MSPESARSTSKRWFATAIAITLLIASLSFIAGFAWLPTVERDSPFRSVWDAICSSAGLVRRSPITDVVNPSYQTSTVVVALQMLPTATAESIGRGGTLALRCTMCHGARGVSDAGTPNLAGQYAPAIYKQLRDFKSGARVNAIMNPLVENLSDRDMRDLAAYYAHFPHLQAAHSANEPAPQIVIHGAPMRNIPPCAACHGTIGYKVGTEWLEGESPVYLRTQLEAFASGERHNDISEQMRNVARGMTGAEIERAADYYAGRPSR
jgi:cytochrome c553